MKPVLFCKVSAYILGFMCFLRFAVLHFKIYQPHNGNQRNKYRNNYCSHYLSSFFLSFVRISPTIKLNNIEMDTVT